MIVFVGEAPGPSGKSGFDGWSGQRLARLFDVNDKVLRMRSKFVNVFSKYPGPAGYRHNERGGKGSSFPIGEAKERWPRVWRRVLKLEPGLVVLLGARVASVAGHDRAFLEIQQRYHGKTIADMKPYNVVAIPHPSGVNRWWNAVDNVLRFREKVLFVVRQAVKDPVG